MVICCGGVDVVFSKAGAFKWSVGKQGKVRLGEVEGNSYEL